MTDEQLNVELERRYSSALNGANFILALFAWCAIGILLFEVLRP